MKTRVLVLLVVGMLVGACTVTPTPTTATPAPSVASSSPSSPSPTRLASGTLQLGDEATANDLAARYEAALVAGRWQAAWTMLAPEQQVRWQPYSAFVAERAAYFHSVAGQYTVEPAIHDAALIRQWVGPDNFPAATPLCPVSPDYDRAFIVQIDYPLIAQYNALDVLLVAPDSSGHWFIWQVR